VNGSKLRIATFNNVSRVSAFRQIPRLLLLVMVLSGMGLSCDLDGSKDKNDSDGNEYTVPDKR
jgi:hypothetical protein